MIRFLLRAMLLASATSTASFSVTATDADFAACKTTLTEKAKARGLSRATAEDVIGDLRYQARVIELDRSQPEFVQTFPGYFSKRVTDWRVSKGQSLFDEHRDLLEQLSDKYGIPPHYLLAFWGLETNFGTYKGKMPVLDSLATLACDERRSEYFTGELMVALELLERESLTPTAMVGSWAGAMGHTQFMPSAYASYAIDGNGDGQVNLWDSEEDALTSAANFLANLGWQPGFRWGREIQLPDNFNYQLSGYDNRRPLSAWQEQGVTKADGSPLGDSDISAYIVVPAGHTGPAFMAYHNFRVIMRWNNSEFYAIAVGHLADRIAGASGLEASLPDLPAYSRDDIIALQQHLNEKGYDVGIADGIIGPATRQGIRAYQKDHKMVADGFPGMTLMQKIGVKSTPSESQNDDPDNRQGQKKADA
ncbi:lytic murein transglycosylase [Alteromonas halophila]|uniref:Lytic transglycosylase n=1 Tax=Alteromonas halophila TaxID=516698 RepID=A0A918JI65_9ALTE|nr:lytic murein transglycosylase [Alteromonas halophila]GGW78520.1 lytic transglycosylase [Alteromonas halophila]